MSPFVKKKKFKVVKKKRKKQRNRERGKEILTSGTTFSRHFFMVPTVALLVLFKSDVLYQIQIPST